jgi:SAM-dependent methyltransferase
MAGNGDSQPQAGGLRRLGGGTVAWLCAAAMLGGRGAAARAVIRIAGLTGSDRVVDVGCGPGTAVREATRHAAGATGVDPNAASLALARWISAGRRIRNVTWLQGSAEHLPLPDACATVVWSLSAVHHWADREAGFAEARRVLAEGGRLLIAERSIKPGSGHAAHGLSAPQAGQIAAQLASAGFTGVRIQTSRAGRRVLVIIQAGTGLSHLCPAAPGWQGNVLYHGVRRGEERGLAAVAPAHEIGRGAARSVYLGDHALAFGITEVDPFDD